jgi:hypothetical protein
MNIGLFCVFDIFSLFLSYNESLQWPCTQAIQGASTRWSHFPRVPKLPAPFVVGGAGLIFFHELFLSLLIA